MFDIHIIRDKSEIVRANLQKRGDTEKFFWIDIIRAKDTEWKKLHQEVDALRHKRNDISREIATQKKKGEDVRKLLAEASIIPQKIEEKEARKNKLKDEIDNYLLQLPNILHDSVPFGKDDHDNVEIRKWGDQYKGEATISHVELLEKLDIADFERSAKISGHGFYFLKGQLGLLNQALIRFAIDHLVKQGYTYTEPPLMIRRKPYAGVVDLKDFEKVMYKIEGEDLYLVATSEHPLISQFIDEILEEAQLPIKLAGYSMCFRREVGSTGIDTKGLFRTHQFNKVEQIIICKPEDSWKFHEELQKNCETILQALHIPYRVVNVCTGDIGSIAAKKYDTEAWMPRQQQYREVASNSNCTDYQGRRLNVRFGKRGSSNYEVAHTLNSTALATSRVLVAILENYQTKEGFLRIPTALQPYMQGQKEIVLHDR